METPPHVMSLEVKKADLIQFKEYAVLHPQLAQVDMLLMRAIREPAGFAHVLVYGPSGVGKTTMIRQIAQRLNGTFSREKDAANVPFGRNSTSQQIPLLVLETRPPDGEVFNRTDYYRNALKLLGEPFYSRRTLIDIETEHSWEKKGTRRTKSSQFNDSPELRQAYEETLAKLGVQAVILDEAQHLMKIGNGASGGKLLDQLDWIKSMSNVTGVLHILIGTYELLSFRNLSGQASRRGLDIHFPRYLYQHQQDREDFQATLLALLKQIPLNVDIPELMQHWLYFYERSIGCVGVLKDWLVRTVAAIYESDCLTLSKERLVEHSLSIAQCERMAIDATEGEQKLSYMESRHEHLWHLLQIGEGENVNSSSSLVAQEKKHFNHPSTEKEPENVQSEFKVAPEEKKRTSRRKPKNENIQTMEENSTLESSSQEKKTTKRKPKEKTTSKTEILSLPDDLATLIVEIDSTLLPNEESKKKTTRRRTKEKTSPTTEMQTKIDEKLTQSEVKNSQSTDYEDSPVKQKRSVGQRKPRRDPVG